MSFLNPSALIALSAIAIPVLIHLLNLRKLKKVEFSTLMFLKEIQKSKMKRIRLKQLLLLLFRILVIAFLVLAFSKPVYKGFTGNRDSKSTVLVFLDDSFSMSVPENNKTHFSSAKEKAAEILEMHKETDEIYLIPFSEIGKKNRRIYFGNSKEVTDSLKALKTSYKYTPAEEILNLSDEMLFNSGNARREIFIVSDFQKSNFKQLQDRKNNYRALTDESVSIFLIKTGQKEISNLSIDSFAAETGIIEKDKSVSLKINLNNFSKYNAANKTVNMYAENELKAVKILDVNAGSTVKAVFNFKPAKTGMISGYFELVRNELSDDELVQDNKLYFSIYIPEKFNIALVSDKSASLKFLETGFKSADRLLSDSVNSAENFFNVSISGTVDENLLKNDAVFISDKKTFSDYEAELLKKYVSDGGGLFLFPGKETDTENYNSTILNKLNLPKIAGIKSDKEANINLKFEKIDFEHPLLSGVFRNPDLNLTTRNFIIENPRINSYFEFLPGDRSSQIIMLNNGIPFLTESGFAGGRIVMSAVSADNEMSDLPLKTIFLPLIIRSAYYLGNVIDNEIMQNDYVAGRNNNVAVFGLKNVSTLITPDKSFPEMNMNESFQGDKINYIHIPYSDYTVLTGEYSLKDSSGNSSDFQLNYNVSESETSLMENEELIKYFNNTGFKEIIYSEMNDDIRSRISESKSGFELWRYMLLGAIIFLAAEILLSKSLEKS